MKKSYLKEMVIPKEKYEDCLSMDYHEMLKGMSKKRIYCHQTLENQVNLQMLVFKIFYYYQ